MVFSSILVLHSIFFNGITEIQTLFMGARKKNLHSLLYSSPGGRGWFWLPALADSPATNAFFYVLLNGITIKTETCIYFSVHYSESYLSKNVEKILIVLLFLFTNLPLLWVMLWVMFCYMEPIQLIPHPGPELWQVHTHHSIRIINAPLMPIVRLLIVLRPLQV